MVQPPRFFETITLRGAGDGAVSVTAGRLDPATGKMVFEHVADMLGDPSDPLDAVDMLVHSAEIYRLRVYDRNPRPAWTPTGG